VGRKAGLTDEKLHAVLGNDFSIFNDVERVVIELADAVVTAPSNISDDLYARLRKQFSEEQLMPLSAQIAFENYRALEPRFRCRQRRDLPAQLRAESSAALSQINAEFRLSASAQRLNPSTSSVFPLVSVSVFPLSLGAMSKISRRLLAILAAITFLSPVIVRAGSKSNHGLTEDAALNLLIRTVKHDNVYAKRISFDCISFETEETTRVYFEFALRENHTAKCGGDPETSPVIDRYRVNRASGKIELYDPAADNWHPYDPAKIGK